MDSDEIKRLIEQLSDDIDAWAMTLNTYSPPLIFIATMSVWSIQKEYLQTVALFLIPVFFFHTVFSSNQNIRPFKERSSEIKENIREQLAEGSDARIARRCELDRWINGTLPF